MGDDFAHYDISAWPLVRINLARAPREDQEIVDFQDYFCGVLCLGAYGNPDTGLAPCPLKVVLGLDGIVDATMEQKLKAAEFIQRVKPLVLAGALKATALIVTSSAARNILELILSLAPLTSNHAVFHSVDDGVAWLATQ